MDRLKLTAEDRQDIAHEMDILTKARTALQAAYSALMDGVNDAQTADDELESIAYELQGIIARAQHQISRLTRKLNA